MTEKMTLPSYLELDLGLSGTTSKPHPSQVHGLACGILSGNGDERTASHEWTAIAEDQPELQKMLTALFEGSARQLEEFLFDFQLVLPSDADELAARAEALTLWCQGYLTGLKLAQVHIEGRSPGEATEAINDIIEIAKMNYEEVVASEEDEAAYVELVEYVRMAAILIYQDMHEQNMSGSADHPSHHVH